MLTATAFAGVAGVALTASAGNVVVSAGGNVSVSAADRVAISAARAVFSTNAGYCHGSTIPFAQQDCLLGLCFSLPRAAVPRCSLARRLLRCRDAQQLRSQHPQVGLAAEARVIVNASSQVLPA